MTKQKRTNRKSVNQKKRTPKETIKKAPQKAKESYVPAQDTTPTSFWNNRRWHIILIFVLSFGLYANTLTHDYALDDSIVITGNSFTKKGISGISEILNYDTFMGFFGKDKNLVAGGRYRPMSLVTFAVEWQFFGENPMISHFINILLFGLTGMILYLLLLKLFNPQERKSNLQAYFLALAATILFVAHPIHTEAVANIKGRDEIMALLGSLTAFYWTLQYFYSKKIAYLVGSAIVFFLALMSKENSITFLAIVPVGLYFFTKEKLGKIAFVTAPYFASAIIFLLIRSNVLGAGASIGVEAQELMNNPFLGLNASERYGTIFYTLGKYIQLLFYPNVLTHDYYPRHIPVVPFSDWKATFSLIIYLFLGLLALWGLVKHQRNQEHFSLRSTIAFGVIFYIASLSVVSNLVFSVGTNMSERLVFMPSVGYCLVLAVLIRHFLLKEKRTSTALIAVAIIGLFFSFKTISRNMAWKDNYTLFSTDIKTSVNSAKLNNAMGGVTLEESIKPENAARKTEMTNEAIGYLSKAIEVHPSYSNAYLLTGNAFFYQDNYSKASEYYRYIAQNFDNDNGKNNLFLVGQKMVENGQFAPAVPILEEAKGYNPNKSDIYGNLGAAYANTGKPLKAVENFLKVVELEPNNAKAHMFIGQLYSTLATNDPSYTQLAQQYIQKAQQLDPNIK